MHIGHDAEIFFSRNFIKHGGKVVGKAHMPLSATDILVYVETALQAKPDALYRFMLAGAPSKTIRHSSRCANC